MEANTENTNHKLKNIEKNYRKELVKYGKNTKSTNRFFTKQEIMEMTVDTKKLKTATENKEIKFVIVGDGAVGKTTFLRRIAMPMDIDAFIPTVYDFYSYQAKNLSFQL
ncbi:predicted protein [Naegleria gruberi]|uniref:Predicted protein n=1 Tax=Naegleria gruberi TaxID=5762 RepID=D2VH28_NAEGR|nr:uncharacterized protein NAEGRDRAFT_68255 [Naegleria gruberi]EFC43816.1 predicted protein [Naegleria gruberi]|eukprot:XP_002676560.1 predicted protein [Naegleria gruberi strain NEG-M]